MMHEQSGLPSYMKTTPLLPRVTDEELQIRLNGLRRDTVTRLLVTTNIVPVENPLNNEKKF